MTDWYFYPYKALTGGADGALDSLDGNLLKDFDGAFVLDPVNGYLRPYYLDEDSATAESSPGVISPDSNADDKRWIHAKFDPSYINVTQSGTGVSTRTLLAKVRDFFTVTDFGTVGNGTTSDQTAVAAAVLEAYTTGHSLFWPEGTYLTTANIPYLHSVKHFGPGVIKRGDNSFKVEPIRSTTNTLYCTTSGVATNDGLGTSQPITVTAAVAALANYGPMLRGLWNISVAAGTYTERDIEFPIGLRAEYPVLVYGPDETTPTAIFDGEDSNDFGFRIRNGTSAIFQDLKFIDFSDGNYAIAAIGGCLLATINVHTDNCYYGILSYNGRMYVGGGDYTMVEGNYAAIVSMYAQLHSIGSNYVRATASHTTNGTGEGPTIHADARISGYGIYIAENATGHVDGCTITNMGRGVYIRSASRANFDGCEFITNAVAVECEINSNFADDTNEWNATGAEANDQTWRFDSGGIMVTGWQTAITPAMVKNVIGSDITSATLTGTTNAHTFHTWTAFFAGHEFAKEGYLKIRVCGVITGTNDTKTLRVQLNTTTVAAIVFAAAAAGDFVAEMVMHNIGSSAQKNYSFGTTSTGHADASVNDYTMTINTGAAVSLNVQGVLANGSDQVVLHAIEVWRGGH